jgi:hypothetical protein
MTEFKGTKGKWEVSKEEDDFRKPRILNESKQVIFTHNISCYDNVNYNHEYYSHNKMMANAKLISAAPELLEAAIKAIEECCDLIGTDAGNSLEEAIKKALN